MKKVLKSIFAPLWSLRFKPRFRVLAEFLSYSPIENMYFMAMCFVEASKLEGDYLEFGVAKGNSMSLAYNFSKLCGHKAMKFYGFDSFQGLPEISGVDAKGFRAFEEGQFAHNADAVKENLRKKNVDLSCISLIPGFYNKTLFDQLKNSLSIKKAAVVMIDCDLYESTVPVLDFITDYIQDGTLIIFDDWFCFRADPRRGEQRAFNEWLKKNPHLSTTEYNRYSTGGNSFIIHKNEEIK